jgi:hypothetical protein
VPNLDRSKGKTRASRNPVPTRVGNRLMRTELSLAGYGEGSLEAARAFDGPVEGSTKWSPVTSRGSRGDAEKVQGAGVRVSRTHAPTTPASASELARIGPIGGSVALGTQKRTRSAALAWEAR